MLQHNMEYYTVNKDPHVHIIGIYKKHLMRKYSRLAAVKLISAQVLFVLHSVQYGLCTYTINFSSVKVPAIIW